MDYHCPYATSPGAPGVQEPHQHFFRNTNWEMEGTGIDIHYEQANSPTIIPIALLDDPTGPMVSNIYLPVTEGAFPGISAGSLAIQPSTVEQNPTHEFNGDPDPIPYTNSMSEMGIHSPYPLYSTPWLSEPCTSYVTNQPIPLSPSQSEQTLPYHILAGDCKRYTCVTCSSMFKRKWDAERHWRSKHGGERPTCPKCGKSMSRKDALKKHASNCQGWV
ncbi:hypothetical protein APHAL10511_000809 [Amanita phalloides]|nr:hypothetical protein APHAL10511_000809 [Amanita phalloides]